MKYWILIAILFLVGCSGVQQRQAAVAVDATIETLANVNDKTTEVAASAVCASPLSSLKRLYVSDSVRFAGLLAFCEWPSYLVEWILHLGELELNDPIGRRAP